jgi:hypothetical protein
VTWLERSLAERIAAVFDDLGVEARELGLWVLEEEPGTKWLLKRGEDRVAWVFLDGDRVVVVPVIPPSAWRHRSRVRSYAELVAAAQAGPGAVLDLSTGTAGTVA